MSYIFYDILYVVLTIVNIMFKLILIKFFYRLIRDNDNLIFLNLNYKII